MRICKTFFTLLCLLLSVSSHAEELRSEDLYKKVLPSVLTLRVTKAEVQGIGTAFLLGSDGIAVTAWHVVQGARSVTAKFADGEEVEVSGLVDKDERRDVALVRVKAFGRPALAAAVADPEVGARAYVIGAPRGLSFTISDGLVSQIQSIGGIEQLQFSCPASPGNSGGPLVDAKGEVVGVVSWQLVDGQNLNFAVPIRYALGLDASLPMQPWDSVREKEPHESSAMPTPEPATAGGQGPGIPARAADAPDANAILDKAIQAIGGQEKLAKIQAASWTAKGTISFNGSDNDVTSRTVVQGIDHSRQEFEGQFGGNPVKGVTVLAGDKGWRSFGDNHSELDKDALANEKRRAYLALIPVTIVPLKGKDFRVETIADDKVGDKPAAGIKVTPPDGKEFSLYFDKESGLPVKLVAKVAGFMGNEFTMETTFSDYQDMAGIKKATKLQSKRDGEKFLDQQITEFKVLDTVDTKTFAEPQ